MCVKVKYGKCKGKLKTNLQYEVLSTTDHSCIPKLNGIEVKAKLDNWTKRVRKDASCLYVKFIRKKPVATVHHNCIKCTKADVRLRTPDDEQKGCPKHVEW